ncbi:hypothetical protein FQA47_023111 [Oryzias melastigma]|uniref:Uncharacterized protein n=1 Tax=Oryzias melastigma TaxID=30732 RepID=A0A834KX92_ORYME|nr:hypothetical protein FQA47_023111 [Oryzias melastigma]
MYGILPQSGSNTKASIYGAYKHNVIPEECRFSNLSSTNQRDYVEHATESKSYYDSFQRQASPEKAQFPIICPTNQRRQLPFSIKKRRASVEGGATHRHVPGPGGALPCPVLLSDSGGAARLGSACKVCLVRALSCHSSPRSSSTMPLLLQTWGSAAPRGN